MKLKALVMLIGFSFSSVSFAFARACEGIQKSLKETESALVELYKMPRTPDVQKAIDDLEHTRDDILLKCDSMKCPCEKHKVN